MFDGSSVTLAPDTLFDVMKPTKVVVHGWGGETHIDEIFASAYAEAGLDYNIIGVDWRDMEGPAQEQVVEGGVYTAHFLQALIEDYSLLLEDVHPIGWSYGAHFVGGLLFALMKFLQKIKFTFYFSANIGKEINMGDKGKLRRITVLDPGQYGFQGPWHTDLIISKDDADYVDVIHTDAVAYGFLRPLGHADFYPNGGSYQPCSCDHNCTDIDCLGWSDHGRAPAYFEESILSPSKFPSWRCDMEWEDFLVQRNCPYDPASNVLVSMGEYSDYDGFPEEGIYYLTTNKGSPYSCEEEDCFIPE